MDIYDARKLQKALFLRSNVKFRKMGMLFNNDKTKIGYFVAYHVCSDSYVDLSKDCVQRIAQSSSIGVITRIMHISDEKKEKEKFTCPTGVYIVEIIEID